VPAASSGRPETREKILQAAGRLFRAHGVDATGVDAIMREAGLTHGGFYGYFPTKEALVSEVSRSMLETSARKWQEISDCGDLDRALFQIVDTYLDLDRVLSGPNCLLPTLSTDVARRPAAREAVKAPLLSMLQSLEKCLGGDPQLSLRLLAQMVGAVVLARIADDRELASAILCAARRTVDG
jgi:TetR/AcrR family transcriptional regulator, transcriptional repressor for nem operon